MRGIVKVIVAVLICVLNAGCEEPRQVAPTEFQSMLERNPESMRHTEFMGVKDGKAYLKVSAMSTMDKGTWTEELYATDASQLPEEWLKNQQGTGRR